MVKTLAGGVGPADSHHSAVVANMVFEVSMKQHFAKQVVADAALLATR